MSPEKIQALRKSLFLEVSEAAQTMGKCTSRCWQYWESGRSKSPESVNKNLQTTVNFRNKLISLGKEDVKNADLFNLKWYKSKDLFLQDYPFQNELSWRVYQSVVVAINIEFSSKTDLSTDGQVPESIHKLMTRVKAK